MVSTHRSRAREELVKEFMRSPTYVPPCKYILHGCRVQVNLDAARARVHGEIHHGQSLSAHVVAHMTTTLISPPRRRFTTHFQADSPLLFSVHQMPQVHNPQPTSLLPPSHWTLQINKLFVFLRSI